MYQKVSAILAAAMLLGAPVLVFAQGAPLISEVSPSLFEGMAYRQVGPLKAGG